MASQGGEAVRVLHVDDDETVLEIVVEHLERDNDRFEVVTETSVSAGLDHLRTADVDCVVSDFGMPDADGLAFLRSVRDEHGDLPFILYTGRGSEEIASEAISAGVTEYLQKGTSDEQYEVLAHRIERAVSERRARAALEESERMFSTLVENLPGVVYRAEMAPGWPMEFVSEGSVELTGYEPAAFESGEVLWGHDVTHPGDQTAVRESVEAAIASDESFTLTYRIRTREAETRWVRERGSGVREDDGSVYLEGFIADITDRRRRRETLREEQAVTEMAIDALDDAFFVLDHETGAFLRWNERLAEFSGYTDEQLGELTVFDLLPEDEHQAVVDAADQIAAGEEVTVDVEALDADRERVPIEVRGSPIYDDDGDLVGIGTVARDVTERKRRERRLEQFAGVVSHDLRNPLHVVQSRIELAEETGDLDHLEPALRAVDRMDEMIDDLLELTLHGETVGETELVDVGAVAREAWRSVETGPASLEVGDPGTAEADPNRLADVFANLYRNAIEHAGRETASRTLKGAIERAHGADGEHSPVRIRVDGDDDGFYVADDGPGIPADEREAVFEYGHSTDEEGNGLGLAIVRSIAKAHDWSISVTDSEWDGARFDIVT